MNEVVIDVNKVSKNFILPHEKINSLKGIFVGLFKTNNEKTTQHALKDISFQINKGEFFGIVGRNGSGKSTLLKILAKIYQPTEGSINIIGKVVPFIELGVGFNSELTGKENVYLNGAILGFSRSEIDKMYKSIVEFAELESFMDKKLKNYSSGMQVRLAFSMAVKAKADILLVDEVLAVGDADFQRKCFDYFKHLKKIGKTVVFVSHDMNAVREFCDRAVLIEGSKIIAKGDANDVAGKYSRLFLQNTDEGKYDEPSEPVKTKRWGDKKVTIRKVELDHKIVTDETVQLKIKVKAYNNKNTSDMVAGFVIKNAEGEAVCGINTQIKHIQLRNLKKGESWDVVFSCPNIFSEGMYTVDVAIHATDGVTAADWWEEATKFKVMRPEKVGYIVTPSIDVKVIK